MSRPVLLRLCAALALSGVLAACSGSSSPDVPPDAAEARLQTVAPTVEEGITSVVEEDLQEGRFVFLSFPQIPGAEPLVAAMRANWEQQVQRFRELTPDPEAEPSPELQVVWELVGASPDAVGVQLRAVELGQDQTFNGDVQTWWWDPQAQQVRPVSDFIEPDQQAEFFQRLREAALADPVVSAQEFSSQLDGEWESFDAIAFTPQGDLWVEFDPAQISDAEGAIGVAVDPQGLLSGFGEAARQSALQPSDPAAGSSTPEASAKPTPSPSPTTPAVDCAVAKCVALTFDDGPVAQTTELLDVLEQKDAKATFFMVGSNVAAHPEIVAKMVAEGHAVGNHTWTHPQLTRLSAAAMTDEITRTSDAIEQAGGVRPTLLRPPYGATNAAVAQVAADLGMAQVLWNVDPEDWKDRDTPTVVSRVIANTDAGDIVLSHDIHATTRAAYASIIDQLQTAGYTLVTVPQLIGTDPVPGQVYDGS